MKFPYIVKHDGVYYMAGEEVPIESTENASEKAKFADLKTENNASDKTPVKEEKAFKLTKTEVNRLSTSEIQQLAREYGLNASLSGAKLKNEFIAKFGL